MGIKLTQFTDFIPEWNGNKDSKDPIYMKLKRMNSRDFWKMMVLLEVLQGKVTATPDNSKSEAIISELDKIKPYFEEYISDLKGIEIDGAPAKPSDILSEPGLLPLITEISQIMTQSSIPSDQDKKKFVKQ